MAQRPWWTRVSGSGARSTETSAMPVPTGTSLCHRSGFTGNGSRDAHCFIGERLILFLAKMNFAWKSQILRFIYQKLDVVLVGGRAMAEA